MKVSKNSMGRPKYMSTFKPGPIQDFWDDNLLVKISMVLKKYVPLKLWTHVKIP